ncbi:hypothetical protein ZWY2020_039404 [Hordeum vulgare]|nr:hypothetical protein ZWY2020_039404 [Hordeum vulgare]
MKSAARCGADVALSLVQVHCKEVHEEKLKTLKVTNTKKLRFEDFMETFPESATRIADGIDLDTFVEPSSPGRPVAIRKLYPRYAECLSVSQRQTFGTCQLF